MKRKVLNPDVPVIIPSDHCAVVISPSGEVTVYTTPERGGLASPAEIGAMMAAMLFGDGPISHTVRQFTLAAVKTVLDAKEKGGPIQ
jgi:hypothetical protein